MSDERWEMPEWMTDLFRVRYPNLSDDSFSEIMSEHVEAMNNPATLRNFPHHRARCNIRLLEDLHAAGCLVPPGAGRVRTKITATHYPHVVIAMRPYQDSAVLVDEPGEYDIVALPVEDKL